ncbi:MAG: hypothetical protein SFX73_30395 [Kofleriaceae bacterium]|nr:hypothetical protein [Kofleriaceae bacterium]
MSVTRLSVRTCVRYVVPLMVLSALVFAPLLYLAWRAKLPTTVPEGKSMIRLAWALLGASLVPLLVLVGGVAPMVRAMAEGRPTSQARALGDGMRGLVRAVVPALLAMTAVVIGGLAFVVPGLALLVLFAMTGASTHAGAARLTDVAERARDRRTALVVAGTLMATFVVHAAAVWITQRGLAVPVPSKPRPEQLAQLIKLLRVAAITIALVAPITAVVLAAIYGSSTSSETSVDRPS